MRERSVSAAHLCFGFLSLLVIAVVPARAQQISLPLLPGGSIVSGTLPAGGIGVEVEINGASVETISSTIQGGSFVAVLKAPFPAAAKVKVCSLTSGGSKNCSAEVTVADRAGPPLVLTSVPLAKDQTILAGTIAPDAIAVEIQVNGNAASLRMLQLTPGSFHAELVTGLQANDVMQARQFLRGGVTGEWVVAQVGQNPAVQVMIQALPLREDTSIIHGTVPAGTSAVEIQINDKAAELEGVSVRPTEQTFEARLKTGLNEGDIVRIRPISDGPASPAWLRERVQGSCDEADYDCREDAEVTGYIGVGIDTFASGATRQYLNPDASNGKQERFIGGFDFAARLFPASRTRKSTKRGYSSVGFANQLWIYGETVHGVRSTDINCEENKDFLTCQNAGINVPGRPIDQILFTIRNASSLEAFVGLRYELLTLKKQSHYPINLYAKAQAGFMIVSGRPDDVVDSHHFGLGFMLTKSRLAGSYFEVGLGRNDLFALKPRDRWKLDGQFIFNVYKFVNFFSQLTVDTDVGHGSDSVQSYFGFEFDLKELTKPLRAPH